MSIKTRLKNLERAAGRPDQCPHFVVRYFESGQEPKPDEPIVCEICGGQPVLLNVIYEEPKGAGDENRKPGD